MAGEAIRVTSAYAACVASGSVANGAFAAGARTDVVTALGATEEDYVLLDFRLQVTSGTPDENGTVEIYRIPGDGANQSPTPAGNYAQHFVGTMTLDNATGYYYLRGVANEDGADEFIWKNATGQTITAVLSVRSRSASAAA